jgi:hypothetical protein
VWYEINILDPEQSEVEVLKTPKAEPEVVKDVPHTRRTRLQIINIAGEIVDIEV